MTSFFNSILLNLVFGFSEVMFASDASPGMANKPLMIKERKTQPGKWSGKVTRESHALDLEEGVFTWKDPERIARSLKTSADASKRRKAPPFRSAMSMLVFYINRAGTRLSDDQRQILEQAKVELRKLYSRDDE